MLYVMLYRQYFKFSKARGSNEARGQIISTGPMKHEIKEQKGTIISCACIRDQQR